MRMVYRVLAGLIAFEVLVQAAAIAYAIFGFGKWVDDGATVDKNTFDSNSTSFHGLGGFILHGINGEMVIPLLALLLLISSFFAKVPRGILFAGLILLDIVVQVFLGITAHAVPALGILHAPNAFVIFGLAVTAMMKARHVAPEAPTTTAPTDTSAARV